jgi:PAS domain S-box-containing protein
MGTLYGFALFLYNPANMTRFDLGDLLYVSSYPAIIVGLLRLPRSDRPSASRARIMVDIAVFLAGIGLPLWYFTVLPGLNTASHFDEALVFLYPLASFCGISVLNQVLLTRAPIHGRKAFFILISAICVWWISDLIYLLDSVPGVISHGGVDWSNASTSLSLVLFLVAAGRIENREPVKPVVSSPAASSPLPFLTVIAVGAWIVLYIAKEGKAPESTSLIMTSLALLFVTLALREVFVYRDGVTWLSSEVERESRARFEILIRNCTDVIMLVDPACVVRFASPAAAVSLGSPPVFFEAKPLLSLIHPEDSKAASGFLDQVLAGSPQPSQPLRLRLRHSDGSYRTFDAAGALVVGDSSMKGMVITLRDVTAQMGLEDKLRQTQKLEAISQLVGGIAHNFNNILTSTMMRLGFIREAENLPPEIAGEIKALGLEAERSAELTRKLVMFSRQQHLIKVPLNLRETILKLQPSIQKLLGPSIQLYVTGGTTEELVMADSDLVEYVVNVICSNARDSMPGGGCLIVEVTDVSGENMTPDPAGNPRPASAVRLSFQDTGCGMERDVLDRLFEPFFTTKGVTVLGLGLASAHGAVKQHDGWIQVESAPGLGTTVRVFFPRVLDSASL